MCKLFKEDIKRYTADTPKSQWIYLLFEQGIWATALYRFGCWIRKVRIPVLSLIMKIVSFFLFKISEIVTGVSLPLSAKVGGGIYLGHFGPIIIHSDVTLGNNCSLGTGVIIGTKGIGSKGVPQVGDNVYIGVGAKLLGDIQIGNNVKIGANAVVLTDVPDDVTVVGIPAKVVR